MYDETGADGKRAGTVAQIATELGVTRPAIYRHARDGGPFQHVRCRRGPTHLFGQF